MLAILQQVPSPLDGAQGQLEPLQPPLLLDLSALELADALLEAGAGAALVGDHLVGLLEEAGAQVFNLAAGGRQTALGLAAKILFPRQGLEQVLCCRGGFPGGP